MDQPRELGRTAQNHVYSEGTRESGCFEGLPGLCQRSVLHRRQILADAEEIERQLRAAPKHINFLTGALSCSFFASPFLPSRSRVPACALYKLRNAPQAWSPTCTWTNTNCAADACTSMCRRCRVQFVPSACCPEDCALPPCNAVSQILEALGEDFDFERLLVAFRA